MAFEGEVKSMIKENNPIQENSFTLVGQINPSKVRCKVKHAIIKMQNKEDSDWFCRRGGKIQRPPKSLSENDHAFSPILE